MSKKKKKQSLSAGFWKCVKTILSWYSKDENGEINRTASTLFEFGLALPVVLFEGIKIGVYDKYCINSGGLNTFMKGLSTPFYKVFFMGNSLTEGFGVKKSGFQPVYLCILFTIYAILFVVMFTSAERNKGKSHNKDGNAKFGNIDKFNEEMAYCDNSGEPTEPPVNSYESGNMILSQNVRYALNPKGTNTWSHALVIAPTRSGKTFKYVKPNALQMNSSYVFTDPKGELVADLGAAYLRNGYDVKIFNINEPQYSCRYNPFHYVRTEEDVATLTDVFLENTKIEGAGGGDPFFPLAEKNFYLGIFFYIFSVYKDQPEKQTFKTVYEIYQSANEDEQFPKTPNEPLKESAFDKIFKDLAKKDPANPSIGFYATFKKGTFKTRQSILSSVGIKLWFLAIGPIANLLSGDDLHLENIGDRKTALFIIIPGEKSTYKFLSAMLFTQLFNTLYYVGGTLNEKSWLLQKGNCIALRSDPFISGTESEISTKESLINKRELWKKAVIEDDEELIKSDPKVAEFFNTRNEEGFLPYPKARLVYIDEKTHKKQVLEEFQSRAQADMVYDAIHNGEIIRGKKELTNHVRFMMDEFFSVGKINEFDRIISTCAYLRISVDIILQSITQLQEMYEDREDKVTSNCSIKILLASATMKDSELFSDLLGQKTVKTEGATVKHSGITPGVTNTNITDAAQLVMRPDEINRLDKEHCLIVVNSKLPMRDKKYDTTKHKRWKETYSPQDHENTLQNQFQFRRLFYIKQDDSNRVVTVLPKEPAVPPKNNKESGDQKKTRRTSTGRRPKENENSSSTEQPKKEEPRSIGIDRKEDYDEIQRVYEETLKVNQDPTALFETIKETYKNVTNKDGYVNATDIGSDFAKQLNRALKEGNGMGIPGWERDPETGYMSPSKDNVLVKAIKAQAIKKSQIFTSETDDIMDLF